MAIYEWSDDEEYSSTYDLKNFNMDKPYHAKRAYLVMIGLYDETNSL